MTLEVVPLLLAILSLSINKVSQEALPIANNSISTKNLIADSTNDIEKEKTARAYYERAESKMIAKEWQAAVNDYTAVISLYPNNVNSFFRRAEAKYALGDKKGAIKDFNEIIKLRVNFIDGIAYYERGKIKAEIDDSQGAIADFNQALKLYPTYAEAYQSRGDLKAKLGDQKGAIADINQARMSEALNYVSVINGGSLTHIATKGEAAASISELSEISVEIKPNTDTYTYIYQKINNNSSQFTALPKQKGLKTYSGTASSVSSPDSTRRDPVAMAIICENQTTNLSSLQAKTTGLDINCPKGSNQVRHSDRYFLKELYSKRNSPF